MIKIDPEERPNAKDIIIITQEKLMKLKESTNEVVKKSIEPVSFCKEFKGVLKCTLDRHTSNVYCITFTNDGLYLLSGSGDDKIMQWEVSSGNFITEFVGHKSTVRCIKCHPSINKIFASGSWDQNIIIWNISNSKKIIKKIPTIHSDWINTMDYLNDNNFIISGCYGGDVIINNTLQNNKSNVLIRKEKCAIYSINSSPISNDIIAYSLENGKINFFDIKEKKIVKELDDHKGSVWCISFSKNGNKVISCDRNSSNSKIIIWSFPKGEKIFEMKEKDNIYFIEFNPHNEDEIIYGGSEKKIKLWNVNGIN
jgi:WD40 repeat protein